MDKKSALRKLLDAYHDLAVASDAPAGAPQDGQGGPGFAKSQGPMMPGGGKPGLQAPQIPGTGQMPLPVPGSQQAPQQPPMPAPQAPVPAPQPMPTPPPMMPPQRPMQPQMAPTGGLSGGIPGLAAQISNTAKSGIRSAGEMGGSAISAVRAMLPGSSERKGARADMYRDIVKQTRGYDNAPDMGEDGLLSDAGKMRRMKDMIRKSSRTGDFAVTDSLISRK